jgi:hypothetical protein
MKWFSLKIWLPVLVCSLGGLLLKDVVSSPPKNPTSPQYAQGQTAKSAPQVGENPGQPPVQYNLPSQPSSPTPPKKDVDYGALGLKFGAGCGGIMSFLNLIERIFKGLRKLI